MALFVILASIPISLADPATTLLMQRPNFEVYNLPWGFPTGNNHNLEYYYYWPIVDRGGWNLKVIYENSFGPICGKIPARENARIIEGIDAPVMFPWMVYIEVLMKIGFFRPPEPVPCTGSIITKRHILSAAHCYCPSLFDCSTSNKGNVKEKNGVTNVKVKVGNKDKRKGEFLLVTRITVHPMYAQPTGDDEDLTEDHDIAILTLGGKLSFNDTVSPICLPDPETKDVGFSIDTAGWGVVRSYDRFEEKDTCTTDQYGAAQFQPCQSRCEDTEPPNSDTCKLLIESHPFMTAARGSVYQIVETGEMCYPFRSSYGWCKTKKSWGFCRRTCSFKKNQFTDNLQYLQMKSTNCSEYFGPELADYQFEMCAIKQPQKPVVALYAKTETGFHYVGKSGGGIFPFHGFYDTCQGDSGGPFWRSVDKFNEKRAVIVGTVSRGDFCASKGKPGVIERVKTMIDWILEETILPVQGKWGLGVANYIVYP